jgi:hypothetical protein
MADEVRIVVTSQDRTGPGFKAAAAGGQKLKGAMTGVGKKIGGALVAAFAVSKAVDYFNVTTKAAQDQGEALNKSNVIFGKNAKSVERWAAGGAKGFGLSKTAALDYAGSLGNMFNQLDFGADQSKRMSQGIVELAADFASFHNADITDVLDAQQAAFRGEYDALQRYIPTISAATVEQEAMRLTGKKSTDQLTAHDKALAVNTIMHEKAGKAVGDFARTSDQAANAQRIAAAELENQNARIGASLLPLKVQFAKFKVAVVTALANVVDWITEHKFDFQEGFIGFAQGAVIAAKIILPILKIIVDNFLTTVGIIINGAAQAFGWVPGVGGKLRTAAKAFNNFKSGVDGALDKAIDKVNEWDTNLAKMRKEVRIKSDIHDLQNKLRTARAELKRPDLNKTRTAMVKANIRDLQAKIRQARGRLASIDGSTADVYIRGHVQGIPAQLGGRAFLAQGGISGAQAGGPRSRWTMVGEHGRELINLPAGSHVKSNSDTERMMAGGGGGGPTVIVLRSDGTRLGELLVEVIRHSVRVRGGNVQFVLGDSRQAA